MKARVVWKGGPGSGNFGHEGRPGEVGGSAESSNTKTSMDELYTNPPNGWTTTTNYFNMRILKTKVFGWVGKVREENQAEYLAIWEPENVMGNDRKTFDNVQDAVDWVNVKAAERQSKYANKTYQERMGEFESEHFTDNVTEWGMCADKQGTIIFESNGTDFAVDLADDVVKRMRGGAFTHTHPGDLSFSLDDVRSAFAMRLKELRVVAANKDGKMVRYTLKGKWPKNKLTFATLAAEAYKAVGGWDRQFKKAPFEKRQAYWSGLWKEYARLSGMTYTEEVVND